MSEATDRSHRGGLDDRRGRAKGTQPASLVGAFVRNAERAPQKLCLRFVGDEWTYGRLHRRAADFAALRSRGLRPRDRVALFLENSPDFLAAYLGTHLAGGVVVKKPRQVVFVDALPRNALGKVLKHEVRKEIIEAEE